MRNDLISRKEVLEQISMLRKLCLDDFAQRILDAFDTVEKQIRFCETCDDESTTEEDNKETERNGYVVMDIPETCAECPFVYRVTEDFFTQKGIGYKTYWVCIGRSSRVQEDSKYKIPLDGIKPKWCPIKVKPSKLTFNEVNGNSDYRNGWNDLIDKMFER